MHKATKRLLIGTGLAVASTAAWAFPWDIDMTDASFFKPYGWKMQAPPEGAVARNAVSGDLLEAPADRNTAAGQALQNPHTVDAEFLALGQKSFGIWCAACHGAEGKGGAAVVDGSDGKRRYPIPPPMLSGNGAVSPVRTDGYIYLTIRNGGAIMPAYGHALNDDEIWAVVAYIRSLPGGAYNVPTPPEAP